MHINAYDFEKLDYLINWIRVTDTFKKGVYFYFNIKSSH